MRNLIAIILCFSLLAAPVSGRQSFEKEGTDYVLVSELTLELGVKMTLLELLKNEYSKKIVAPYLPEKRGAFEKDQHIDIVIGLGKLILALPIIFWQIRKLGLIDKQFPQVVARFNKIQAAKLNLHFCKQSFNRHSKMRRRMQGQLKKYKKKISLDENAAYYRFLSKVNQKNAFKSADITRNERSLKRAKDIAVPLSQRAKHKGKKLLTKTMMATVGALGTVALVEEGITFNGGPKEYEEFIKLLQSDVEFLRSVLSI